MKKYLLPLIIILLLSFTLTSNCVTVDEFLSTGTWTCPAGVTVVKVECRGSGGGGGGVAANTNKSSGGGAGGQYAVKATFAVTPTTQYTVTVGNGGTAGANTGGNGGDGGDVWFSSNDTNGVVAKGGGGGQSYENGKAGGNGSTTGGFGDTVYAGGDAGDGGDDNSGGGGGEGAASTGNGTSTSTVTGASGTDGGDGGNGGTNAAGAVGTVPGGGGGGAGTTSTTNRLGGAGGKGKVVLTYDLPVPEIDIGAPATDRAGYTETTGYTFINELNPANETGTITSVEIWGQENMTGVKVAIFTEVSADHFTARDSEAIAETITAGSKVTKTVDLNVVAGDVIGIYWTGGDIEMDYDGGTGVWYLSGDQTTCSNTTFTYYTGVDISLYGTGATAAPPATGNAIMFGTNF